MESASGKLRRVISTFPKKKQLVFDNGPADSAARLMTPFGRIDGGIPVLSFQRSIPKVPIGGTVKLIGPALDHRIDNASHGTAEFGAVSVGLDLEFLDGILTDAGGYGRTAGSVDTPLLCYVVAILQKLIAAGDPSKCHLAGRAVGCDARRQQRELIRPPAVSR